MPAQAIIRKLTKDQVVAKIASSDAKDVLDVHDDGGILMVVCKPANEAFGSAEGSAIALQSICDDDSALVRADQAVIEAQEIKKVAAEKKAVAAAEKASRAPKP